MRKSQSSERVCLPAAEDAAARERDMQDILDALSALAEAAQTLRNTPLRSPSVEDLMRAER